MPIVNGYGFSEYTDEKQECLRGIFTMHARICAGIMRHKPVEYHYVDMNAGPGQGSPSIFLEVSRQVGLPCQAHFIEWDAGHFAELTHRHLQNSNVILSCGDHTTIVSDYCKEFTGQPYGLFYNDPSGTEFAVGTFEQISRLRQCQRMDILIYYSCTNNKRRRCSLPEKWSALDTLLQRIDKKIWIIREPDGPHQWTFLLGTNWTNFPEWRRRGFYHLHSPKGQAIFERLNYSKEEQQERQRRNQLPLL